MAPVKRKVRSQPIAVKKAKTVEKASVVSDNDSISDDGQDLMAAAQRGEFDEEDSEAGDWESQSDEDAMEEDTTDAVSGDAKKSSTDADDFVAGELEGLKETAELYKSNIFKLEIDELLAEVGVDYDKHKRLLNALRSLKSIFEKEPETKEQLLNDYIKNMEKKHKIIVPILDSPPPQDAQYKFKYQKPSSVNVIGGYALRTICKLKKPFSVDVAVEMPSTMFQEKDYVNNRYFYKRACYLAALAYAIRKAKIGLEIEFGMLNGDAHRPILLVKPSGDKSELDFTKTKCIIRILPCAPSDVFPVHRLAPGKANMRHVDSDDEVHRPTPQYNASVLMDTTLAANSAFLYQHSKSCEGFRDAIKLGRIWLHQRGLDMSQTGSGFNTFLFAMIMGYLLQGGLPGGGRKLSTSHSSYQLLRGTIDFLSTHDFEKDPVFIGKSSHDNFAVENFTSHYQVVIVDPTGTVNMAAHMSKSSLDQLQHEAKLAMSYLNDTVDRFEALFLRNVNEAGLRFDNFVTLPTPSTTIPSYDDHTKSEYPIYSEYLAQHIGSVLKKGLTNRVDLVAVQRNIEDTWDIQSEAASSSSPHTISIGLILNPDNAPRLVDQGPDAQKTEECKEFREFWGDKAELRRFKDGSIVESVVWNYQGYENRSTIVQRIVQHLIKRHFGISEEHLHYWASQLYPFLHVSKSVPNNIFDHRLEITGFQPVMTAYNDLAKMLRSVDGELPLLISNIYPCSPALRYSSPILPHAVDFNTLVTLPTIGRYIDPIDVIVQLERSSKWPDDMDALQKVKAAFCLRISDILKKRRATESVVVNDHTLTNDLEARGYLDVYFEGFVFRCHLHVPHEELILKSIINKNDGLVKEKAQKALQKHLYQFHYQQLHTFHIQALCAKFPALSATIRLVKRWFSAHLLSCHVTDELVELLCSYIFVDPHPWTPPTSPMTGAMRVLHLLATWTWHKTPLLVDIEQELTTGMRDEAYKNFTLLRQRSPQMNQGAMFVATSKDLQGVRWSQSRPNKAIAVRIQMLAKESVKVLSNVFSSNGIRHIKGLYTTSMADYHAVIQLKTSRCTRYYENIHAQKNHFAKMGKPILGEEPYVGFDPVTEFVKEIMDIYGDALLVFYDKHGGDKIGLVWDPQVTAAKQWRVGLGLNTVPADMNDNGVLVPSKGSKNEISKMVTTNFSGILKEIERLGAGLVESITSSAT